LFFSLLFSQDLQGTLLDDAVDALTKFQDVEWPPREPNAFLAPALPEWMKMEETSSCDDLQMLMSDGKSRQKKSTTKIRKRLNQKKPP